MFKSLFASFVSAPLVTLASVIGVMFLTVQTDPALSQLLVRQSVIFTCEGDPPVVTSSQSSATAPIVSLDDDCAQVISDVLSAPLTDINATWQVKQTKSDKRTTTYTIFETVQGVAGPPGPEGPPGAAGVIDLTKIYIRTRLGSQTPLCDAGDKVLGGGGFCQTFDAMNASVPFIDTTSAGCSSGLPCEGWTINCQLAGTASPRVPSQKRAICIRP